MIPRGRELALQNDRLTGNREIVGAYLEGDYCPLVMLPLPVRQADYAAEISAGFRAYCMQHGAHASKHTFAAGVALGVALAEARHG